MSHTRKEEQIEDFKEFEDNYFKLKIEMQRTFPSKSEIILLLTKMLEQLKGG